MCEPGDYSSESPVLWFSKCGPEAAAVFITWGRVQNAVSESERQSVLASLQELRCSLEIGSLLLRRAGLKEAENLFLMSA